MSSPMKKTEDDCIGFRDQLEEYAGRLPGPLAVEQLLSVLPFAAKEHTVRCNDCQSAVQELVTARTLLNSLPSFAGAPVTDAPWFATRVMAVISAREEDLSRTRNIWSTTVPRIASRLAWVSALLLVAATTWLYEKSITAPPVQTASGTTSESLFDASAYAAHDDVLANTVEREQ